MTRKPLGRRKQPRPTRLAADLEKLGPTLLTRTVALHPRGLACRVLIYDALARLPGYRSKTFGFTGGRADCELELGESHVESIF